ncbi:MAG: sugar transferase, partial [Clostridium sp.]|nr:sugar transferase [Clostridium sp.]
MKNARTKHLDFIIGDMVALGLAQFLMVLMNQDKLNPVLYMYYVQLGLLLVII